MTSYSQPSSDVYLINIPNVKSLSANFVYNFYVQNESVRDVSGVPAKYLNQRPDNVRPTERSAQVSFELRTPRYVVLSWKPVDQVLPRPDQDPVATQFLSTRNEDIQLDSRTYKKIISQENFTSDKFTPYVFSTSKTIEYAYRDINRDGNIDIGKSPESNVNEYIEKMLSEYADEDDDNLFNKRQEISAAVASIEKMADRPYETHGLYFFDQNDKPLTNVSGFDQAVNKSDIYFQTLINTLVLPDVFLSSSITEEITSNLNKRYSAVKSRPSVESPDEPVINPVYIGNKVDATNVKPAVPNVVGYVIEKYRLTTKGFVKEGEPILINDTSASSITDVRVMYGSTYYYSIKTVASITTYGYDDEEKASREIVYLISSKPQIANVECIENVPPPPPEVLDFLWDYKASKLTLSWQPPVNAQRDIKQYQVFRRSSIHEPFELLVQKSFDASAVKYSTGEVIDGNRKGMTSDESFFVEYTTETDCTYRDDDFVVDIDLLDTSKYIYTVCSVDAHGLVSNYGPQIEVKFDFFKNILVKDYVSISGAPRQYPNMKINIDLFKDVIKVQGQSSKKMSIYFMPEYFNIRNGQGDSGIKRMVSTKQDGEYYKIQFINLQNQKSDSVVVNIDDEENLTNFNAMPKSFVRDI